MTPLFACFPVCLTFVGLAILGLLVLITGVYSSPQPEEEPKAEVVSEPDPNFGPPPWWVVVLIFAVPALAALVLAWLVPEWD